MLNKAMTAALAAILLIPAAAAAADPAVKCEAGKLKESSKYAACRLKAESKAVLKGVAADYTKCDDKFTDKWAKIETKAEGACLDEVPGPDIRGFLTYSADSVAEALGGGTLPKPACGNAVIDAGEDCDQSVLGGADCDSATGGDRPLGHLVCGAGCVFDMTACTAVRFEFQDLLGETTVVDHQTGLEWLVPEEWGYLWSADADGFLPNGTLFTVYLAGLNASAYGGHDDWRIPEIGELETIVDLTKGTCGGASGACIDEALFGPTPFGANWSNTTDPSNPTYALYFDFFDGTATTLPKFVVPLSARGVRTVF